ncbi:PEP-CTERM sorting domain-containing protein [Planctomycetota bacterium]|nr:PEP-CTERM sorting domain-containing protein [Planctomycetota bacterium]
MNRTLICTAATALVAAAPLHASTFKGRIEESTLNVDQEQNPASVFKSFGNSHGLRLGQNQYPGYTIEDTLQTKYRYSPIDVNVGEEFEMSFFNFWNGKTIDNTAPTTFELGVNFDFLQPYLAEDKLTFDLLFVDSAGTNGDYIKLPENLLSKETFAIDEAKYAVELTGLKWDGKSDKYSELKTKSAYSNNDFSLFARFVTVPEPGTVVLVSLGVLAIAFDRRKKRSH